MGLFSFLHSLATCSSIGKDLSSSRMKQMKSHAPLARAMVSSTERRAVSRQPSFRFLSFTDVRKKSRASSEEASIFMGSPYFGLSPMVIAKPSKPMMSAARAKPPTSTGPL